MEPTLSQRLARAYSELDGISSGYTRAIGAHVVTRWPGDRYEIDTCGRETLSVDEAANVLVGLPLAGPEDVA